MKTTIHNAVRTWFAALVLALVFPNAMAQSVTFDTSDKSTVDQTFIIDKSTKSALDQSFSIDTSSISTSAITGTWTGTLTNPNGSINVWQEGMTLAQNSSVVSGSRYSVAGNKSVMMALQGTVAGNQFTFADTAVMAQSGGLIWCMITGTLTVSTANGLVSMTGNWTSSQSGCGGGNISLTKTYNSSTTPLIFTSDISNNLLKVDTTTGVAIFIGNMGSIGMITDLALSPSGELWGITSSALYKIDQNTAIPTLVENLGISSANALEFSPDGTLYTASSISSILYTVNASTGSATSLPGSMGTNSSGDLAFNNGQLYLAGSNGQLVRVNLGATVTGTNLGPFGVANVYGLTMDAFGRLVAIAGTTMYQVNTSSGALTPLSSYSGFGAAQSATVIPSEQTAPERLDGLTTIGAVPSTSSGAIVITHGWNSNTDTWVREMANDICMNHLGASQVIADATENKPLEVCKAGGWDVWIVDWRKDAGPLTLPPLGAWVNAIKHGNELARLLFTMDYSKVHLIAHSAGANLIDMATKTLTDLVTQAGRAQPQIHATFLDAYDPSAKETGDSEKPQISGYGLNAENYWADNYVDTRLVSFDLPNTANLLKDWTKLHIPNAYNVDVTPVTGVAQCLSLMDSICDHSRPYRFYGRSVYDQFFGLDLGTNYYSVDPVGSSTAESLIAGMGFGLSQEKGWLLNELNSSHAKGQKCAVSGSQCVPGLALANPSITVMQKDFNATVESSQGAASWQQNSGSGLLNLGTGGSMLSSSMTSALTAVTQATATEAPAWLVLNVTTTQPVDTLTFDWRFATGGEGFLRVFVDGETVREIDQRHVTPVSQQAERVYIGGDISSLPPGTHRIAFRLDGFGTSASGVELTNVELGASGSQVAGSSLSVVRGWNLVGNGSDAPINVATTFSDTSSFVTVWKWIAAQSAWAFHAPSLAAQGGTVLTDYVASKGYQLLTAIAGGEGFWVNAKTASNINLPNGNAISIATLGPTLITGWNLVSVGASATPKQLCDAQSGGVTTLWAWDAINTAWYFYAPSLDASSGLSTYITSKGYLDFTTANKTLGPGMGFWVNKP